jgi:hypothetical protein
VGYASNMAKRPAKKKPGPMPFGPDTQQLARKVLDAIAPDAEPPKAKKPARPAKKQDAADIDRAESEGMGQPQGTTEPDKNPAAVALGRLGGLKGGKARAAKLTAKKRSAIAKKAAQARWKK